MIMRVNDNGTLKTLELSSSQNLSQLSDTTISSPTNGQIIKYNSLTSKWTNENLPSIPIASSTVPSADGTGTVGTATEYARADHVHPKITQAISISSNVITLTGSDGTTSSVTLPVYNESVTSVNGQTGDVTITIPANTSDLTNDSGYITGMTILSYGNSNWTDFIDAYTNKRVVYCRASSNSNPASGSQTRLAFMAYVNNADNPTEVEFQYYRSVSSHSNNQQGDQVYVYKLNKSNGWSVTVRESYTKVVAGTGLTGTWASGAITLKTDATIENTSNKTTTLSSSSTDTEYPSAKAVYDAIQSLSSRIDSLEQQ